MFDCGLNTPRNPIIISSDSEQVQDNGGGIIMDQFVRYCRMVESKQPISIILKALHLGYLPKSQLFWQQCKRICDEVVSLRVDRRPPNTHGDVGSESDGMYCA